MAKTKKSTDRSEGHQPTQALIRPGLSIWNGTLTEEYLQVLKPWSKAVKVFTEMADDAVIGALLESIKTPLLSSPFEVHPASDSSEDKKAAAFLEDNLFNIPDMEWLEHVEEMLEFLDFGWAISEKVLEKRQDGLLHLRSLTPVGQETLFRWGDVDEFGKVTYFEQRDAEGRLRKAPMEKLLHFTLRSRKRNPQGRSLLRSLYRPWFFKKNLETLEAIGAERDVGNAPVAELGEGFYSEEDIAALKTSLEGFRMDEALYIILPHGTKLTAYGGGSKVYNVREMIRDWQHLIRQRFFADFLALGSEQVGTQALAREMTTFFSLALRYIQFRMLSTWNHQLVPWLFHWNRWSLDKLPQIAWSPPGQHNLQSLAQAYSMLIKAGLLQPDRAMQEQIRLQLGLPPVQEAELIEQRKEEEEKAKEEAAKEKSAPEAPVAEESEYGDFALGIIRSAARKLLSALEAAGNAAISPTGRTVIGGLVALTYILSVMMLTTPEEARKARVKVDEIIDKIKSMTDNDIPKEFRNKVVVEAHLVRKMLASPPEAPVAQ